MDNKVHDLLKEYGINISLEEEEKVLKAIQEKNKENELKQVEYKTILNENRRELEKLMSQIENGEDIMDLERLSDKEYLKQTIVRLGAQLEEDRDKFNHLTSRAIQELGGI